MLRHSGTRLRPSKPRWTDSTELTEPALELRIDLMVDELIQNVLADPQFKAAFFRTS